jgi:putative transcriptional regulator
MDKQEIIPGALLCSTPYLGDEYFERTVVLITRYSEDEGAEGLVLNRSVILEDAEKLGPISQYSEYFYLGGPVAKGHLFCLHRLHDRLQDGMLVYEDVYFGGDFDKINELVAQDETGSLDLRFFLGFSGWEAGQLEDEIEQHTWFVFPPESPDWIFNIDYANCWRDMVSKMGHPYTLYLNGPLDPQDN